MSEFVDPIDATLYRPGMELFAPNGDEDYYVGSTMVIDFACNPAEGEWLVMFYFSVDGGKSRYPLSDELQTYVSVRKQVDYVTPPGYLTWDRGRISAVSDQWMVFVYDYAPGGPIDHSDTTFCVRLRP